VRPAFAMTINKAQGQTLSSVGLYLPTSVFGHGQLYVAFSRVKTPDSIKILLYKEASTIEGQEGYYSNNVLYKEVLFSIKRPPAGPAEGDDARERSSHQASSMYYLTLTYNTILIIWFSIGS
jgi:hypothetical protein